MVRRDENVRTRRQVRIDQIRSALLFGTIAVTIGNWVALVLSYLSASATMGLVAQVTRRFEGKVDTTPIVQLLGGLTPATLAGQLVATPLLALAGLYLTAGIIHLLLLVVRGAPRRFDGTLTVVGYASGIMLLRALPVCGGLIALVWFAVVMIHGLAEAQRCGTGKAAFAVLSPVLLLCACACLAGVVALLAGMAGLHGLGTPPPPGTGI